MNRALYMARSALAAGLDDSREWAPGRYWQWRAPILLYLAYAGLRHLASSEYGSWFSGITFGIHELGHVLFAWGPKFLMIAGGSLCQLAAPVAAGFVLGRQRDWFGVAVAMSWLSFSLWNLAAYIGDARAQRLPLLGMTDDPIHDWHWLLGKLHLLSLDTTLAFLTRVTALGTWALAMTFGGWLLLIMAGKRS